MYGTGDLTPVSPTKFHAIIFSITDTRNSSATTYYLRTPSSLLLLARLTGLTGSFPLLVCAVHFENASAEPVRVHLRPPSLLSPLGRVLRLLRKSRQLWGVGY